MTAPKGSNDINLAALWVPVMPETSQMAPAMKKAGEESKKAFVQGFTGGSGGTSPEELGRQFGTQFMRSFQSTFAGIPLPRAMHDFMGSLGSQTEVSSQKLTQLRENASRTYGEYQKSTQQATELQTRLTRATNEFNTAVSKKQDFMLPAQRARQAQQELATAIEATTQKQDEYNAAATRLADAQGGATRGSNIMAAAIGGGIGAAATLGVLGVAKLVESITSLYTTTFKLGIEGAKELSSYLVTLGESYESTATQVELYSSRTGSSLEALQRSAQAVFGQLDTDGKNTGQTMAILSQRLGMEAGPALEKLTYHVEELRGRFGSLDINALSSAFVQFGINGNNADAMLASLVQSSREAGVSVSDVVSGISGSAATLSQAGLDFEQSAAFIAELTKQGLNAGTMITGLQSAAKQFGDRGLGFEEGMHLAAQRIKEMVDAGDELGASGLAQTLFGTGRWADALKMIKSYDEIIKAQPGSFAASVTGLDQFIDSTQTLSDKWTEVKRRAGEALLPFGAAGITVLEKAIGAVKNYIDQNSPAIMQKVRALGNSFIEALPGIKSFAADSIRILGVMVDAFKFQFGEMMFAAAQFGYFVAEIMEAVPSPVRNLIPGYDDMGKSIVGVSNAAGDMAKKLQEVKVTPETNKLADWIDSLNIDVPKLKDNWGALVDDVNRTVFAPRGSLNPPGTNAATSGSGAGRPGSGSGTGGPIVPTSGAIQAPGSHPLMGPISAPTGTITPGSLEELMGAGPQPQMGQLGAEAWRPTVESVVAQLAPVYKITNPQAWVNALVKQIDTESKGDPNSLNPNDSNGRGGTQQVAGLLNFLESTYNGANVTGRPFMDPVGQIAAAIELSMRHGLNPDGSPKVIGEGHGFYAMGGTASIHPGQPRGTDTVAAWLTPGEEVINAESAARHRVLLKAINANTFQDGGMATAYKRPAPPVQPKASSRGESPDRGPCLIPGYWNPDGGTRLCDPGELTDPDNKMWPKEMMPGNPPSPFPWPPGYPDIPGMPDYNTPGRPGYNAGGTVYLDDGGTAGDPAPGTNAAIHYVESIAEGFGLVLTSGLRANANTASGQSYHLSGEAGDFGMPGGGDDTDAMLNFATYMAQAYGANLAELIYHDSRFSGHQIGDGHVVDDSYYANAGNHHNHVHVAIKTSSPMNVELGSGQIPSGSPSLSPSASMGGMVPAGGNLQFPGLPGQYGGYGAYGQQDYESVRRNEQAIKDSKDRLADMDYDLGQKQKAIDDRQHALDDLRNTLDPLTKKPVATQEEIDQAESALADAKHDYAVGQRERADQVLSVGDAERKAQEDALKPPKGSGAQEYQIPGVSAFTQLGGGLVSGIAQGLGFGDIFGKAPWEWGAVKLLAGLGGWGLNTANVWADEIGKGHTGMTNFQQIPGWEQQGSAGLMGLLGGMAPGLQGVLPQAVTMGPGGQYPNVSAGINVSPTTNTHGGGMGQLPGPGGPMVQGDYQPINVTNNGGNQSDYDTWRQAQNGRANPQFSGLPRPMG